MLAKIGRFSENVLQKAGQPGPGPFGFGYRRERLMTASLRRALSVGGLIGLLALSAAAERIELTYDSHPAFDEATRDRFIAVDADPARIRLARSFLLTNETGKGWKRFDELSVNDLAKVSFALPCADVDRAVLLMYFSYKHEGKHPKFIEVNGKRRPYVHDEARMLTGGWARHDIPAGELRTGINEVVIGGGGGLHVDAYSHTGRSARSFDAGRTWNVNALGPDGTWEGEYIVRLRVYGYPQTGRVTSPVLDPAVGKKDPVIRPAVRLRSATLRARTKTPASTDVAFALRSGTTPTVLPKTWTHWRKAPIGDPCAIPGHRYLQWRATLTSTSPKQTPAIDSVTVSMEAEVVRGDRTGLSIDAYENPRIVRSSYPFVDEEDTPRIRHLREKHRLRDVIVPGTTELDRQAILRKWVSHQWKNGWDDGTYEYVPPWNALELLELARDNLSLGMCTHYSCTYVQSAVALGFNARSVILDHHCVAEVWSNELGKWVLQDAGPGEGPKGYPVGFAYRADGRWLDALEVHRAFQEKTPVQAVPYKDLKEPWALDEKWMELFVRFGIPLRNNHLSEPEPAEVEHGRQHYRWDRYLWWSDSLDRPTYEEYSLLSNRVGDFYWTINRVAMDLQGRAPRTITVNLDTCTPNFEAFEANIDGRPWARVRSGFGWKLHGGTNALLVRAVNHFGVRGPVSRVILTARDGPASGGRGM